MGSASYDGRSQVRREMAIPIIEAQEVTKTFDQGRTIVLDSVSMSVTHAQTVAIVGPSGSGKTTLLNLLSGLETPTAGAVLFEGRKPQGANEWRRIRARKAGIVFQSFNLLPTLTAAENVQVPMLGIERSARRRRQRSFDLLAQVGLLPLADELPGTLSGGERQRVAIARSLANRPSILLADEPTGNLDRATSERVVELLAEMVRQEGLALVVVTHDAVVAGFCGCRLRLADGRLTEDRQPGSANASGGRVP
jgi:ABC-type lipoprotein export system ATPase subunit